MDSLKERFKEILIREHKVNPKELDKAVREQQETGRELGKILVERDLISEAVLSQALSESLNIPQINISRIKIVPEVVRLIPQDYALKYNIIPISLMGDHLTLAMADPLNIFVIDSIQSLTGYTINPILSTPTQIETAINQYYNESTEEEEGDTKATLNELIQNIRDTEEMEIVKDLEAEIKQGKVEEITEEAPIIKLTDTIISQSVLAKASDVFIEPMEKSVRIRYRVDGVIREIDRLAKVLHFPLISRIKVIANLDISEHRLPQDGRFKTIIGKKEVDFRVNVLPAAFGEKVVLRVLDQDASFLDIEKLGFEDKALEALKECSHKPHGMILTCGPTGSGKTTTLYSILKYVDSPGKNIVTVEDPVEYQMPTMNQVNIKPQMGLNFSNSLRSILRQDPDIIMIGEIRDTETLDIAVKAALTGHLVLSSLHTTTAAGSVIRMMNMGIEPFLICSSVLAIVAQRLIRRICTYCKESYKVEPAVAEKVGLKTLTGKTDLELYRGKGCAKCMESGYQGRVGINEILILTPGTRERILNRMGEFKIKELARKEGMRTMREDGLLKALDGITSLEEVLRITAPDDEKDIT